MNHFFLISWIKLWIKYFGQIFEWIFYWMNISNFVLNWILNWIIFGPDSMFDWIIETYRTGLPRDDGLFNLKLPFPPQRVTTLFYLHQYMHEPGYFNSIYFMNIIWCYFLLTICTHIVEGWLFSDHGRGRIAIPGASQGRVKENRKNKGNLLFDPAHTDDEAKRKK